MAGALQYLTVQDVLWINLQITKTVNGFRFADLEEAVYYQYGYGPSLDLDRQAARFLSGFAGKRPIEPGCDATAFVGALAFLEANGRQIMLKDSEGAAWFKKALDSGTAAIQAAAAEGGDGSHGPTVREAIAEVLDRFPRTIEELAGVAAAR